MPPPELYVFSGPLCVPLSLTFYNQQSLKREVNQLPYELPTHLEKAIADFVDYYNYRRYHKALNNITPADVLCGRREAILQRRKEVQILTISRRRDYNQGLRELANAA